MINKSSASVQTVGGLPPSLRTLHSLAVGSDMIVSGGVGA